MCRQRLARSPVRGPTTLVCRSLGIGASTPGKDPMETAVNNLASSGVAVVVAAGNDGGLGACVPTS